MCDDSQEFYSAIHVAMKKFKIMEEELTTLRANFSENLADGLSTNCSFSHSAANRSVCEPRLVPMTLNTAFLQACFTFLPHVTFIQLLELIHKKEVVGVSATVEHAQRLLLPQFPCVLSLFTSVVTFC